MLFRRFKINDQNQLFPPLQVIQAETDNARTALEGANNHIDFPNHEFFKNLRSAEGTGYKKFDEIIEIAGYAYDPSQDIFISRLYPWQRNIGYYKLFDTLAPLTGMIFDSEPIYFDYQGERWMIGLWKGQYDLVTGAEIGVYKSLLNFGAASDLYYRAVSDDELLSLAFTLKKNGQTLFTRKGKHWWLTGFKLGEFSEPSELTMDIEITFPEAGMRDAFVEALRKTGYQDEEITVVGNIVSFTFDEPYTPQPSTRNKISDHINQKKNKFLCDEFNRLTGTHTTVPEKIKALEEIRITDIPNLQIFDKSRIISKFPQFENLPSSSVTNKFYYYTAWGVALLLTAIILYLLLRLFGSDDELQLGSNLE
ncbi:MAG: DUF4474 domain-containing protein [Desulfitobacteriia bacterium]